MSEPTDYPTCILCDEPMDREWLSSTVQFMHRACSLREVTGGIGHLIAHEYWCGPPRHDPDAGLTYRQSALLTDAFVQIVGVDKAVRR